MIWTVVNIFVGIGLLSKPYATAQGGWVSLLGLTVACAWAYYSAVYLVYCMHKLKCYSYPDLGRRIIGSPNLVLFGVFLESGSALMVMFLFLWKNLLLVVNRSFEDIVLACFVACLPLCLDINVKDVEWVSIIGCVGNVTVILTILGAMFFEPVQPTRLVNDNVCMSLGIYIVALGGHTALPQIFKAVRRYEPMVKMLRVSFFLIWVVYFFTASAGYLTFGDSVDIIVTTNLNAVLNKYAMYIFICIVSVKTYTSIVFIFNVFVETPTRNTEWKRTVRFITLVGFYAITYLCRDYLNYIETLTGSICIMFTSFLLPSILYAVMINKNLPFLIPLIINERPLCYSKKEKIAAVAMVVLAVVASICLVVLNVIDFAASIKSE